MPDGWPAPLPEWANPVPKGQAYADTITAPPAPQGPWNRAFGGYLKETPGWTYSEGPIPIPLAKGPQGQISWALPGSIRHLGQGILDLLDAPTTGTITPAGTSALMGVTGGQFLRAPGELYGEALASGPFRTARGAARARRAYWESKGDVEAPPPEQDPTGITSRISTRVPTSVKTEIDPHATSALQVGLDASKASGDAFKKNADLIRNYPNLNTEGMNDEQATEAFINHLRDNLTWLHDQVPEHIREQAKLWYDGANNIANKFAERYRISRSQAAGVLASLSPQKDWFQNVSLAHRVLDIRERRGNRVASPAMQERLQAYVDATKGDGHKALMQSHLDAMAGKPFGQLTDPMQQAMWARAYDEAHNPRAYQVVNPDGTFGDWATSKSGDPQKVAWGSFKEIHKALSVLQDGSRENISRSMGGNHKVRNFFNNIVSPNAPFGDVTIDTHAIGAANMMPLGSNHPMVSHGLGLSGSSSNLTGSRGLYGLYAEAHRRASADLGILPRELQSITWEGVRGLFSPEQKRNKAFVQAMEDIWRQHKAGEIDADTARDRVVRAAAPEGIRAPQWVGYDSEADAGP